MYARRVQRYEEWVSTSKSSLALVMRALYRSLHEVVTFRFIKRINRQRNKPGRIYINIPVLCIGESFEVLDVWLHKAYCLHFGDNFLSEWIHFHVSRENVGDNTARALEGPSERTKTKLFTVWALETLIHVRGYAEIFLGASSKSYILCSLVLETLFVKFHWESLTTIRFSK